MIVSYSLMDYSNGLVEIPCLDSNVIINNNDTTRLFINRTVRYDQVKITSDTLLPARVNDFYTTQLEANHGATPYRWDIAFDYNENISTSPFPNISTTQLTPSNNDDGYIVQSLPFSFPFYGKSYNQIVVHTDGYIMFDNQLYTYPYMQDPTLAFVKNKNISVYNTDLYLYPSNSDGIWYDVAASYVTIRWKASISGNTSSHLNFAARLYKTGQIEFFYGALSSASGLWFSGITSGEYNNYQLTGLSNKFNFSANQMVQLTCDYFPTEMSITEDGVFSGTPLQAYSGSNIKFRVTDNNNISKTRTLNFFTNGTNNIIITKDSVLSGGDTIIDFGETASLGVFLKNIGTTTLLNGVMKVTTTDPYVTMIDSVENLPPIPVASIVPVYNSFSFHVNSNIPDGHTIVLNTLITSSGPDSSISHIYLHGYAPVIKPVTLLVDDGLNQILEAGETSAIKVAVKNNGGSDAINLKGLISSLDTNIIINSDLDSLPSLLSGNTDTLIYSITAKTGVPVGYIAGIKINFSADNNFAANDSLHIYIGFYSEDFESAGFVEFPWNFSGSASWTIDTLQPFEGTYCARSGVIGNNSSSVMYIEQNVIYDGYISFYKKVSCEQDTAHHNFDYLAFYIDGVEKGRWDGTVSWSKEKYPVTIGQHQFRWEYKKNYTGVAGADAAWIDYIAFPPIGDDPLLVVNPSPIVKTLLPNMLEDDSISVANNGDGILKYSILVSSIPHNKSLEMKPKSIDGCYVKSPSQYFHTGVPIIWTLSTYNPSTDSEWLKDIFLSFPNGVRVDSAKNFVGGSGGPMVYDGVTGNGVTVNWHGQDVNNWGVVKGGEAATATIYTHADSSFVNDLEINYQVNGDVYGSLPHIVYGTIEMLNLGLPVTWFTLDDTSGTVNAGMNNIIGTHFNSQNLEVGKYNCDLLFNHGRSTHLMVPVTLNISGLKVDSSLITRTMSQEDIGADTLKINNVSNIMLYYLNEINNFSPSFDTTWLTLNPLIDLISHGDTNLLKLTFDTHGLAVGFYSCRILINDLLNNVPSYPDTIRVRLHVTPYNDVKNIEEAGLKCRAMPNPFNGQTNIAFTLPYSSPVSLEIFNINGQKIKSLLQNKAYLPGDYRIVWNGDNESNTLVSEGVYFYRLTTNKHLIVNKLVVFRN